MTATNPSQRVFYFTMFRIEKEKIKSYKITNSKNYDLGGFYLIKNRITGKCYIGKSIDYMARIKQHTYKSNCKTEIDKALNDNPDDFDFYLIYDYKRFGINFYNRKLESIIEHRLISKFNSCSPEGYNIRHYEHL